MPTPGSLASMMPPRDDDIWRTIKDLQRQISENAASRSLAASSIGTGGTLTVDGSEIVNGSLTVNGTITTPGTLNSAGAINAGTSMSAGTTINAGGNIHGGGLISDGGITAGGSISAAGDVSSANVIASAQVISAGIVNSPGTKANTVTIGYSAVYIDSSGNMGGNTSSRRFKTNLAPAVYDLDALLGLTPYQFQRITDVLEMGAGAAPWQSGLMAEDVEPVAPLNVWHDENGLVEGVRYEELVVPLLMIAQRERNARIALETRVTALEARLTAAGIA